MIIFLYTPDFCLKRTGTKIDFQFLSNYEIVKQVRKLAMGFIHMVAEAKEVGKNRYRESYGRYLEDFKVGDVYEHRPGRTISESDNTWFTLITMSGTV